MSKVYLPIGASESGSRPPADIDDNPFIYVDGTVMLLNEMIHANVRDHEREGNVRLNTVATNVRRYTVKFRPHWASLYWLQGNVTDVSCDYITVEDSDGARYEITDISPKRIQLI